MIKSRPEGKPPVCSFQIAVEVINKKMAFDLCKLLFISMIYKIYCKNA